MLEHFFKIQNPGPFYFGVCGLPLFHQDSCTKSVSCSAWAPPDLVPSMLVLTTRCKAELLHWLEAEPIIASDLINRMLLYL